MLRITFHHREMPRRLQFEGKLAEPFVGEAQAAWDAAPKTEPLVADVEEVTAVDRAGWKLLEAMAAAGAGFVSKGVKMAALLDEMKTRIKVSKG